MVTQHDSACDDAIDQHFDMFQEPQGYFEPEKPFTYQRVILRDGSTVELRLVGHNPLWGHHLWQAARIISDYLEQTSAAYLEQRSVLELGAAAALPSIVAARHGASVVMATDYPDADLIANIHFNLQNGARGANVHAEGFLWGADPHIVKACLLTAHPQQQGFDTLILADLLFNHSCHAALVDTIRHTMKRASSSVALVFFTPYRPWLFNKDMAFFGLVEAHRDMIVEKLGEWKMDRVMFEEDLGDEELRRTVFGYAVKWAPLASP